MLTTAYLNGFGFGDAASDAAAFTCGYYGSFYVCAPKTAAGLATIKALQRAADAVINKLPFFITWKRDGETVVYETNPIGASKSGYDGKLGPFTAGMVQLALLGALELRNQAGQPPASAVLLSISKETDEKYRTQKQAYNAAAVTAFLTDTSTHFDAWLVIAQQKAAAGQAAPPVVLQPLPVDRAEGLPPPPVPGKPAPPVPVEIPPVLDKATKSGQTLSRGPKIMLGVGAGIAAFGLAAFLIGKKKNHSSRAATKRAYHQRGRTITVPSHAKINMSF